MAPHRCHICGDVGSPTAGSLMAHYHCCHGANDMCFYCSKQFRTSAELDAHEAHEHPKSGRLPCPFCSLKISGFAQFWAHVRNDHAVEAGTKQCDRCLKWFRCADQLLLHNRAKLCPNRLLPSVSTPSNSVKRPTQTSSIPVQGSNISIMPPAELFPSKKKRVFRRIYRCSLCTDRPGHDPIFRKIGGHLKNFHNIDPKTHRNFNAMMEQMLLGEIDPDTGQISYANNKSPQPETIDLASVVDIDDDRDDDVEDDIASFEDGPSTSAQPVEIISPLPNSTEISVPYEEIRSTETPIPTHSRRSRWDVRPEGIGEQDQIRRAETPDYKYLIAPGVVHPSRSPNGSIGSSLGIRVHFGQPEDSAQRQQQWVEKASQLKEMQADLVRMNERIQEIINWGNATFL